MLKMLPLAHSEREFTPTPLQEPQMLSTNGIIEDHCEISLSLSKRTILKYLGALAHQNKERFKQASFQCFQ